MLDPGPESISRSCNTVHSEHEPVKWTDVLLSLEWLHHPPSWQDNTASTCHIESRETKRGKGCGQFCCVSWREGRWSQFPRQQKVWSSLFLVPSESTSAVAPVLSCRMEQSSSSSSIISSGGSSCQTTSVAESWHFSVNPDPDPRINATD